MAQHAMSDDQVTSELKKMTAFIRQEALEKSRELQLKADEEFSIEKSKLVRSETAAIDASYTSKFKQASMSQQISRSLVANKTRLRILGRRQEVLDDLVEKASGRLKGVGEGKEKVDGGYEGVLKGLVLEGMYAMEEKKLTIRVREQDQKLANSAIDGAKKEFKDKMGYESEVTVDEKNWLPKESAGGVFVVSGTGKIDLDNTLETRLRILQQDALPQLRTSLFGANENRKFTD